MSAYGSAWSKTLSAFKHHFLLIVAICFGVAAFLNPTPLDQQTVLQNIFGFSPPASIDMPTVFTWFFYLVFFILFADSFFINQKAFHSDYVWMNGLDRNCSCIGESIKIIGDWCYTRTEGIKDFPVEGNYVLAAPTTHVHKVGTHRIIEAHAIPKLPLTFIPMELKLDIRQRRNGLFGADSCAIGILSPEELTQNREFKANDYGDLVNKDEKGTMINTASFIQSILNLIRDLNMMVEMSNGENESITKHLGNIGKIGEAVMKRNNQTLLDKFFGR